MTKLQQIKKEKPQKQTFEFKIASKRNGLILLILAIAFVIFANYKVYEASADSELIVVEYYFSFWCEVCEDQEITLDEFAEEFAAIAKVDKRCVTLIAEAPNECIKYHGKEKYDEAMDVIRAGGFEGTPCFRIAGEKSSGVLSKEELKQKVCYAKYWYWGWFDILGQRVKECK